MLDGLNKLFPYSIVVSEPASSAGGSLAFAVVPRNGLLSLIRGVAMPTFLILSALLTISGCNRDEPTEPDTPKLGKRDYAWTADTLKYPGSFQTNMRSMYATSSHNIFIVGHNDINRGKMYHYDGQQWSPVLLTASEGGPIQGAIDLTAIHGNGPNNMWAVGEESYFDPLTGGFSDSSLVLHFDGIQWSKESVPKRRSLWCVAVLSTTQVFAGGRGGVIYIFDGALYTLFELGSEFFFSSIVAIAPNEVYAIGTRNDYAPPLDSAGAFLFRFNESAWIITDSVLFTPLAPPQHFGLRLVDNDGSLYSSAPDIYKYQLGQWEKLFTAPVTNFFASGANNMIAVGKSVYHFNGQDWSEFPQFRSSDWIYSDCYADGNEVFVLGTNGEFSFVLHGK